MSVRVIGDRVLVALPPEPDEIRSESGLVLMRDPDVIRTPTQGIVMALGEKVGVVDVDDLLSALQELPTKPEWYARDDAQMCCEAGPPMVRQAEVEQVIRSLKPAAFDVEVGDCVIFPRGAGDQIEDAGVEYVILREHEIIGIVAPKAEAA